MLQVKSGKKEKENWSQPWFADMKLWYKSKTVSHMPLLALCALYANMWNTHMRTHTYSTCAGCCYSPDLHMENKPEVCTYTQTHRHAHTRIHVPVDVAHLSQSALVYFLFFVLFCFRDGAECCQGKAVYASICSVLFCAVLNMTHIKRLWVVLSLFKRGCSLFLSNYWQNSTHTFLREYKSNCQPDCLRCSVFISIMEKWEWEKVGTHCYKIPCMDVCAL